MLIKRPPIARQSYGRSRNPNLKLDLSFEPQAQRALGIQNMHQFLVNYLKPMFVALRIELDVDL